MLDIKVVYCNNPSNPSPAIANRVTNTVYLNLPYIKKYAPEEIVFIILHEIAHIFLQTKNEFEADQWAFEQYIAMGYSLTDSVEALTRTLHDSNPEHVSRAKKQLYRAKILDKMQNKISNHSNFFGKLFTTEEGRSRRQRNRQMKLENREARKNQKIANQTTLASMGISERMLKKANTQNIISGIAGAATGLTGMALGGGSAAAELGTGVTNSLKIEDEQQTMQQSVNRASDTAKSYTPEKKWYQKPGIIVGIGSGLALLGVAGWLIYKRTKKQS